MIKRQKNYKKISKTKTTKKRHTKNHMLVTSTRLVLDNAKNEHQYNY